MFAPLSLLVLNHEFFLKSCSSIYQNPLLFASILLEGSWVIYKTKNSKHWRGLWQNGNPPTLLVGPLVGKWYEGFLKTKNKVNI